MGLVEKAKETLKKAKAENKKINAFLSFNESLVEEAEKLEKSGVKGKLYGKFIGIKSNICVEGLEANCASKTLEGWIAPYDATVIKKVKAEGGLIVGMLNMDEFACGSSGESSAFGATQNPSAFGRVPGGSSSGSAAVVAAGMCDLALGSDTGGSIRCPASHCGVVGMKPSYGAVSRYGLIDLSMSLDQIAPIGKSVKDVKLLFETIKGKDSKDSKSKNFVSKSLGKNLKVGVLKLAGVDKKIQGVIDKQCEKLSKLGWKIVEVNVPYIELAVQTYYPLVYAEFFSGTRKFEGRRFGKKIEESCGKEVLRRILGGSEITKAEAAGRYYHKALYVKKLIRKSFEEVFSKVDCIVLPTFPILPWKVGEGDKMKPEEIYAADALTIPANLAGLCAISLPAGKVENVPVGMQIMCARGEDGLLLEVAESVEKVMLGD